MRGLICTWAPVSADIKGNTEFCKNVLILLFAPTPLPALLT